MLEWPDSTNLNLLLVIVSSSFPSSPAVSGAARSSRLCKRALYTYFRSVAALRGCSYLLELPTCHSVKVSVTWVLVIERTLSRWNHTAMHQEDFSRVSRIVFTGFLPSQVEALVYQAVKDLVRQNFLVNDAGPWNSKKLVDHFGPWTWTPLSFLNGGRGKKNSKFDDLSRTNPASAFVVCFLVCGGGEMKEFLELELSCGSKIDLEKQKTLV